MNRPGIEPRSPGPLANTLPTRPMSRCLNCVMVSYGIWQIYEDKPSSPQYQSSLDSILIFGVHVIHECVLYAKNYGILDSR